MVNALILNVLFIGKILFERGGAMIVLSDGEKWYEENRTHYEPMSLHECVRFGRGEYDYTKMAQVEHYSVDVCYSYLPVVSNSGVPIDINYKVIWCFSLTRMVSSKARYHAGEQRSIYVYLTTEEVKSLYKDPKSIWDKAERWCEDKDNEEEDNE